MTELKNVDAEIGRFRQRAVVASTVVMVLFFLLALRLMYLQIIRHEDLLDQAESNRTAIVPIIPNRGLIHDRNGFILASNYSAYTLEITPSKTANLDATLEGLASVVDIQPRHLRRFKKQMEESKSFESIPIRTRLTETEVARFAAQKFRFPGVEIKARLFRSYPHGELASHVIGYIGRINQKEKEQIEDNDPDGNYRGTEFIGKLGVEQSYEKELHGITGVEEVETSAGGRAVRKLASSPATPGNAVYLTIDIKLQHMIETLYGERRGALVAIDPRNGEILAFVSKPTFDPNLFVEGIDQDNWAELNESIDKPLLNRALRGTYPPGSTYKPFMAMAALHYGKRTPTAITNDPGYWMFGSHKFRSHGDEGLGAVDMYRSIVKSSNVYYYSAANDLGVDAIHDFMKPMGFGQFTGIDIQGEVRGVLPSQEWKRNTYKKPEQQRWYAGETISLGIGQGYNSFTMLQLAQATAIIANNGVKYRPHLISGTQDSVTRNRFPVQKVEAEDLHFNPEHVEIVRRALVGVTQEGTSVRAFAGAKYLSGGKTGTAQAVTIGQKDKYNAGKMEEHKRDHALYMAYAPAENPTIALAIVVENAGFGAEHAAPIARRVFDYWVAGLYPSEEDMVAVQNAQAPAPIGKPRLVSEIPWPPKGTEDNLVPTGPVTPSTGNTSPTTSTPAKATSAPR